MAKIDDFVRRISDPQLRADLEREVKALRSETKFGLVFEGHLPENALLYGVPIKLGQRVAKRSRRSDETYSVVGVVDERNVRIRRTPKEFASSDQSATGRDRTDDDGEIVPVDTLIVVKHFGEPIYPTLTLVDRVARVPDKPYHVLVNADNFHALQLLLYCYEAKVDLIYIDPPYNTGARDWKYNNDYVDTVDPWRHSKWLSFMERRLCLAKRLLKPNGVLVVTIDEHEIHHLGCLLAQVFPEARRQMVTIVNNAAGVTQGGFYRVEEYAFFCFLGNAKPVPSTDDLLSDEGKQESTPLWFSLIRYGGINALPSKRPGLVYPIFIDPECNRIAGIGKTLKELVDAGGVVGDLDTWEPYVQERLEGYPVIWPYRGNGSLATWQLNPATLLQHAKEGFIRIRPQSNGPGGNAFSIAYVKSGTQKKIRDGQIPVMGREPDEGALILGESERNVIPKTVWKRTRHDAGKWGSRSIREVLGNVSFDYAKSPYAVLDTLRAIVGDRPDALILDFFAGSGTTLHSTCLLNAEDGESGRRRCILVTNNEVEEKKAKQLRAEGYAPGDPEFEQNGICQSVTWPRSNYIIRGQRDDGTPLAGAYLTGREMKDGFEENVAYFNLGFLDPNSVARGDSLAMIVPILWLIAGGRGDPEGGPEKRHHWYMPQDAFFAVLIDEDYFTDFRKELRQRPDIRYVFLVTDSDDSYREMAAELPGSPETRMLYKSYLENFKINIERQS